MRTPQSIATTYNQGSIQSWSLHSTDKNNGTTSRLSISPCSPFSGDNFTFNDPTAECVCVHRSLRLPQLEIQKTCLVSMANYWDIIFKNKIDMRHVRMIDHSSLPAFWPHHGMPCSKGPGEITKKKTLCSVSNVLVLVQEFLCKYLETMVSFLSASTHRFSTSCMSTELRPGPRTSASV